MLEMSYFRKNRVIGITFSGKSVHFVICEKKKGISYINLCEKKTFSHSLFENDFRYFNLAIEWIIEVIKKTKGYKSIPVYISIPDPVVYSHTFTFDNLPKKSTDEFVEWKLSSLYHLDKNEYGFQNLLLSTSNSHKIVLSLAIQKNLLEKIILDFMINHIPLMEINSHSCINFNSTKEYYDNQSGAHIFLNKESWSIILWDERKTLKTIKSKWISTGDESTKVWGIVQENLERMIRVHIQENPKSVISAVYVTDVSEGFASKVNKEHSISFKSLNRMEKVKLFSGCSLIESFAAIQ